MAGLPEERNPAKPRYRPSLGDVCCIVFTVSTFADHALASGDGWGVSARGSFGPAAIVARPSGRVRRRRARVHGDEQRPHRGRELQLAARQRVDCRRRNPIQPNTAVILFYVLSGFVLGELLRRHAAATEIGHLGGFRGPAAVAAAAGHVAFDSVRGRGSGSAAPRIVCRHHSLVQPVRGGRHEPGDPPAKSARSVALDQFGLVVDLDRACDDRAVAAAGMVDCAHERVR